MGQAPANKTEKKDQERGEVFARIVQLGGYMVSVKCDPEYFDPEVKPAAEDWLKGEIADLTEEYFRQKKEAATVQGDYHYNGFKNNVDLSIPASEQEGKGRSYVHI